MKDIAYELAANAVKVNYDTLPGDVVNVTKKFILDTLATTIGGSSAHGCKSVVDQVKDWSGKEESTIQVYGGKVPSPSAALANAMMAHALDFDDTHDMIALHANVSVLPSALAMAEQVGNISGKDFIAAVVVGVDIVCRLGLGVLPGPLRWILTSTAGYFGAAAACGKILGLDESRLLHAMGIAYSQCAGNAQCLGDGGLVKRMQPAFAARGGVTSALLARRGITGAKNIFEGKFGFYPLYYGGQYNRDKVVAGLGKVFEGKNLSIKLYPCGRYAHGCIDAALEIVQENKIAPEDITEVVCHVTLAAFEQLGRPFEIRDTPQTDAQFSIAYTVAVAIARKNVGIDDFFEQRIRSDMQVLELARKIRVVVDQEPIAMGFTPCVVDIKTRDGKSHSNKVTILRGDPRKPASMEDIEDKLRKCAAFSAKPMSAAKIEKLIVDVKSLESARDAASVLRVH